MKSRFNVQSVVTCSVVAKSKISGQIFCISNEVSTDARRTTAPIKIKRRMTRCDALMAAGLLGRPLNTPNVNYPLLDSVNCICICPQLPVHVATLNLWRGQKLLCCRILCQLNKTLAAVLVHQPNLFRHHRLCCSISIKICLVSPLYPPPLVSVCLPGCWPEAIVSCSWSTWLQEEYLSLGWTCSRCRFSWFSLGPPSCEQQ